MNSSRKSGIAFDSRAPPSPLVAAKQFYKLPLRDDMYLDCPWFGRLQRVPVSGPPPSTVRPSQLQVAKRLQPALEILQVHSFLYRALTVACFDVSGWT